MGEIKQKRLERAFSEVWWGNKTQEGGAGGGGGGRGRGEERGGGGD